ncbi:zeta toxin family protein [Nocardioides sp.]|uniref:zeta toxin family protein n=1 Tax=Nocardioides sp. TaxID=35761 RepID=UPI002C92B958|nr:zeta toxin family protein [Nocardioides sp.]HXH77182.1 zeta toxin family protein [Nocardioides sp.]
MAPPLMQPVCNYLENMMSGGGPLDTLGPNATHVLFAADWRREFVLDEVREEYLALKEDVTTTGRLAVVMSGPMGAGKTTLRQELCDGRGGPLSGAYRVIDPDMVKDLLLRRAVADGTFEAFLAWRLPDRRPLMPRELAGLVHAESNQVADDIRSICMRRGEDIVIEGTLRWDRQPGVLLDELDDRGYRELTILGAEVNLEESCRRARERWWNIRDTGVDPMGGRFVPRSAIAQCYREEADVDRRSLCWANAQNLYERASTTSNLEAVSITQKDGVELHQASYRRST